MNQFDKIIEKEKTKQNFIYIFVFILIFAVAILLILYFLYSKGVNLVITPNEVSKSSVINIIKGKGIIYNNKLISLSNKITIEIIAKGYKKNIALLCNQFLKQSDAINQAPLYES